MSRTDADYLHHDPFEGDRDTGLKCRTVRIVRVRKQHPCHHGLAPKYGDEHVIERGDRARHETALIDGNYWGSFYVCLPCMNQWLDYIEGEMHGDRT